MDVISYIYAASIFMGGLIGYFKAGKVIESCLYMNFMFSLAWPYRFFPFLFVARAFNLSSR